MAAKDTEVDITNEEEMRKFMVAIYNLQQLAKLKMDDKSRSKSEVKIGRNEPCPYGSGKKYKKCCGRDDQ